MFWLSSFSRLTMPIVLVIIILLFGLIVPATNATGKVIFVTPNGTGDGTAWNIATNLQAAFQSAGPGDQIWMTAGVYKPSDREDRSASFELKSGVAVYGGFSGGETNLAQRLPEVNLTLWTGDLLRNDTGAIELDNPARADNSYHVVTANAADSSTILDGITITGGNASAGDFPNDAGGGMLNQNSNLTLHGVTFRANSAEYGGGLVNYGGKPVLQNVMFDQNRATMRGGGLINVESDAVIVDTTFTANNAAFGGGINNTQSQPTGVNIILRGNTAEIGGGMHNVDSNPTLVNAVVSGNQATIGGGGIASDRGGSPSSPGSDVLITNSTIYGNTGGGISSWKSSLTVRNSIIWNNTDDQIIDILESTITVQTSLVQGGYEGRVNIITADPMFVDADGPDAITGTIDDDLRLQAQSPAVDAGNIDYLPLDALDLDEDGNMAEFLAIDVQRNPRINNDVVDLGAYEASLIESDTARLYLPRITR